MKTNTIKATSAWSILLAPYIIRCIFLLSSLIVSPSLYAQTEDKTREADALFELFKKASGFDRIYPREKVYVHTDNTAYMVGDTIWYKAFVVRASSLKPTDVSRVLYVDLLNADGQQMDRQMLRIDSLGQADGCFALQLPVHAGYYELRAYTRAMTNWSGYFSRVIPVFTGDNPQHDQQRRTADEASRLTLPQPDAHDKVTLGNPRPHVMGRSEEKLLTFYPEGGFRAKGIPQRIAYELTDGRGIALDDSLVVYDDKGRKVVTVFPEYAGRGTFELPSEVANGYVCVGKANKHCPLPTPTVGVALKTDVADDGLSVMVMANDSVAREKSVWGMAVICREKVCYFDTLTIDGSCTELFVPRKALRGGVNRVELFDVKGKSYSTRLVWVFPNEEENRTVTMRLQQNKSTYGAFEPAVVTIALRDKNGQPVQSTLSVAVRDRSGNITETNDGGIAADLLLASELKGYVSRPDLYFEKNDAAHRRMLDLLLMVQGWEANAFDVMCGVNAFELKQPVEVNPILRGQLFTDNARKKPRANYALSMSAYSLNGGTMQGNARTDKNGRFAFENNSTFEGDYYAQFSINAESGKKHWSRLALDNWFAPTPRPLTQRDLTLNIPLTNDSIVSFTRVEEADTFAWRDTIPRVLPSLLAEAKVTVQGKYHGFTGTRYTWRGGERKGMERSMLYYNVSDILQRMKDEGKALPDFGELLPLLNEDFSVNRYGKYSSAHGAFERDEEDTQGTSGNPLEGGNDYGSIAPSLAEDEAQPLPQRDMRLATKSQIEAQHKQMMAKIYEAPHVRYRSNYVTLYINNEPWYENNFLRYQDNVFVQSAEDYKSITFVPKVVGENALTGQDKRMARSNSNLMYVYEVPDKYRLRSQKGREGRLLHGFAPHVQFYSPDYRRFDMPTDKDIRRTLYWNPCVRTNSQGETHVVFFTNSRQEQWLDVSVRGVSKEGWFISK